MSLNEAEIFDRARSLQSADARRAYLDQVCSDPELRRRIEKLLAEDQDDSFLEQPVMGDLTVDRPVERAGTTVGPYKLLEVIGEGGMGTVYLAQQFEPVKRRVAVKLVKPGIASSDVVARFEVERQALALMEHPHIAKFYDAGETSSGSPYFVMEFVSGVPVTKYCDEKRLSIQERLTLFRKICQAVQHAHQKGIMHRDLKPSNILITTIDDQPVPKIIDFGLAKAAGAQLTDATLLTNFGQVLGTLQYMSPEQTRSQGEDIDTRTDIYSLGAILYELLVGSPPFEVQSFKERAFDEVLRMIREEDPPTPNKRLNSTQTNSEVADQRQLNVDKMNRLVKGDLEWIVMRSLEKDRARRYQTADALADDIQRFVEFRPVEARAPGFLYRTQKFLRRNRVGVTVASSVIITALIGITLGFWQVSRTRQVAKVQGLVNSLVTSQIEEVPRIIDQLAGYGQLAESHVQQARPSTEAESPERLRVELALLNLSNGNPQALKEFIFEGTPDDIQVIRSELEGDLDSLSEELWQAIDSINAPARLLNIASVLALQDQGNPNWESWSDRIVDALLQTDPFSAPKYIEMLLPIGPVLHDPLLNVLASSDDKYTSAKRDLVASIANKYFGKDVDQIIDFLLESEPSQFRIMVGSLENDRDAAITRLKQELESEVKPSWNDAPLNPAWTRPSESDIQAIVEAGGMVKERFALCQNMPLDEFVKVSESLRSSGYRPTRCRPYSQNDSVLVAAVWTRDDLDWKLFHGQSQLQFIAGEKGIRKEGFQPIDVARYVAKNEETPDLITSLWVQKSKNDADEQPAVYFIKNENKDSLITRSNAFQSIRSIHRVIDSNGAAITTILGIKGDGETIYQSGQSGQGFWSTRYRNYIHADIHLSRQSVPVIFANSHPWSCRSGRLSSYRAPLNERMQEQLRLAEEALRTDPEDMNAIRDRAIANHFLRRDKEAIKDMNAYLEANPDDNYILDRRAVTFARLGDAESAWSDFNKHGERLSPEWQLVFQSSLEATIAIYLGEFENGLKKLESQVSDSHFRSDVSFMAAHAYAHAASIMQNEDPQRSNECAKRAVDLLRLSIKQGGVFSTEMLLQQPDFETVRNRDEFSTIIEDLKSKVLVDATWKKNTVFSSKVLFDLNSQAFLTACQNLSDNDLRPVAISCIPSTGEGSVRSASVWHKPSIDDRLGELAARRISMANIALMQIGATELAWPKLKFNNEPRLRSWIINRVSECGVSADVLFERIQVENDPGIRQALILMLGEIADWGAMEIRIKEYLVDILEHDPNAGMHSASEWSLRKHGLSSEVTRIRDRLAGQASRDSQSWHVSKTGHTMIEIEGPVEFMMGDRINYHRQRIERSFAISSKEFTLGQIRELEKKLPDGSLYIDREAIRKAGRPDDTMRGGITWINAAKICRLLSELEGIPEEEMCFPPLDRIHRGMSLPANYLERTGYRMPTEAEWEYAARAGSTCRRIYGTSMELLPMYAWFGENTLGFPQPVGYLKPNDFGLFDVLGNAAEWTDNFSAGSTKLARSDNAPPRLVGDGAHHTLRGASFLFWDRRLQIHYRMVESLERDWDFAGIRLARTLKKSNLKVAAKSSSVGEIRFDKNGEIQ